MNSYKINFRKACIFAGLLCLIGGTPALVSAQDGDMANRLRRLENEVQTLSRALYKGETPPPGSFSGGGVAADTEIRLQQLESDIRDLRGKVEEVSFENRKLRDDMERITSDMELRLGDLEGKGGSGSSSSSSYNAGSSNSGSMEATRSNSGSNYYNAPNRMDEQSSNSQTGSGYQWGSNNNAGYGQEEANTAPPPSTTGQLGSFGQNTGATTDQAANMYENAYSLIKNSQYDQAQSEFKTFMQRYPDHALAGNAQYWLGETYYVKGEYDQAARAFAEGYQKYPKNSKSADNLLKLGLSLDALGKKDDACVAFNQLKKENLSGSAPVMRRAEQEMSRLSC